MAERIIKWRYTDKLNVKLKKSDIKSLNFRLQFMNCLFNIYLGLFHILCQRK